MPVSPPVLSPATLDFLRQLRDNNRRDWFTANRVHYETARAEWEEFVGGLITQIGQFDDITGLTAKDCLFRIHRDVRFSKDKSPYKVNFAAAVGPGGRQSKHLDYYLHLEPGASFLGGGVYEPTGEQRAKIRQEIDYNAAEIKAIVHAPAFARFFGEVQGTKLKTTPKGYDRQHPDIELLRLQQFFFTHPYSDTAVQSPDFLAKVVEGCRILKPLLDFFNYILFEEKPTEK
ncbi:MAG: DUF2461 domain-containing protein [Ferruginibacter sp.]|nr:DUF2461 domain-containing protein [Cytophagales bacterium]